MSPFNSESRAVAFITYADGGRPEGTGFFIWKQDEFLSPRFGYLVTAAHIVRRQPETYVRMRRGGDLEPPYRDVPIPQWVFHNDPGVDVAVAPVNLSLSDYDFGRIIAPEPSGPRRPYMRPSPGGDVYFIGLLGHVSEMGRKVVPMIRRGTLGALYQEKVPVTMRGGTRIATVAHLIDAHSHAGFSGSPCFSYRAGTKVDDEYGEDGERKITNVETVSAVRLIGMIRGHFPHNRDTEIVDDDGYRVGKAKVPVNAGVAIVTPSEHIGDVLMYKQLVEDRKRRADRI